MVSLVTTAYFTSFYEVFEEKHKNGWRWRSALKGSFSVAEEAEMRKEIYGERIGRNIYGFKYEPDVDDFPPLPKYLDELPGAKPLYGPGDFDETISTHQYETWRDVRSAARKPPVEDVSSEVPWVGGKPGLFPLSIPNWIKSAYKTNVLKANSWRGKPSSYPKDFSEFQPVEGPWGCRDKRETWLKLFSTGIWEEKVSVSRRAARAFGTYRKSMWKVDPEVKLLPCDGANK